MVDELKKSIENQRVLFGIKECLKKSSQIEGAIVSSDCREEIRNLLSANKIKFNVSEHSKEEISKKLGLVFRSEVFGLKK